MSGIELDFGLPLGGDALERHYIEPHRELSLRFADWLRDPTARPLRVTGQIGCGKTTFIRRHFSALQAGTSPDLTLFLDTELAAFTPAAVDGYLLGKLLRRGARPRDDSVLGVCIRLGGGAESAADLLEAGQSSTEALRLREMLIKHLEDNAQGARVELGALIRKLEADAARPLFVFVEGLDKLAEDRADYFACEPLLDLLSGQKTLYETNLLHSVRRGPPWKERSDQLFLPPFESRAIRELLERRLGIHARHRPEAVEAAAHLSGGNPRQALRLLLEYHYARERLLRDHGEAMAYAARRVQNDFLKVGTVGPYVPLLKAVARDGFFLPNSGESEPLLWNWVIVTGEPRAANWPARVNPLLEPVVDLAAADLAEDRETAWLRDWAERQGISTHGLDLTRPGPDHPDEWARLLDSVHQQSELPSPIRLDDLFEQLASYFLDPRRHDLYLVAYGHAETARLANDYLVGRAGTYRPVIYRDLTVSGAAAVLELLRNPDPESFGYSLFFAGQMDDAELSSLDERRDLLLGRRMIWWIEETLLPRCLGRWPHLRQFFRIVRLEREIRQDLNRDSVVADLDELQALYPDRAEAPALADRLRRVLEYLEHNTGDGV